MNRTPSRSPRRSALAVSAALATSAAFLYACSGDDNVVPVPVVQADASVDATQPVPDASPDAPTGDAGAAPCSSLPGTLVYVESGDTQEALLKTLGRQLRDTANITLVFELTGSCTLTPNLYAGTPIAAGQVLDYIPSLAEDSTWTTSDPERTCTIASPTPPDLGISALYPGSCQLGGPDAGSNIGLIDGPIQAYTFVVPPSQFNAVGNAVSAGEAHAAFGANKGTGLVTYMGNPEWNVPSQMFFRPASKSTLVSVAFNIQLQPADMANGGAIDEAASSGVLSAVAASTNPATIGILGDEVYDTQGRSMVNVLAFQAFGQAHAYFPDSTVTAFDKQNIRDGHYSMWSPTVYIAPMQGGQPIEPRRPVHHRHGDGEPERLAARRRRATSTASPTSRASASRRAARCRSRARIEQDGTPISAAPNPPTCTCYFLSKIPGATGVPPYCTPCGDGGSCGQGQSCIRGFCEGAGAGIPPAPADGGAPGCDTSLLNGCTDAQFVDKVASFPDAGI